MRPLERMVFFVGLIAASITVVNTLFGGLKHLITGVKAGMEYTVTIPTFLAKDIRKLGATMIWSIRKNKENIAALQDGLNKIYGSIIKVNGVYDLPTSSALSNALITEGDLLAVFRNVGFDVIDDHGDPVLI